ncbi:hypothetical protein [Nonomuraea turcica]|uniref:hypothetical protein n=1 Tax=Nonomuraea sp. G32 TaxID=3067274 RepID=UPI00273C337A|nr:hypothetical protein [Nonomuraea sp. G32]MDP4507165.1 hypothetical protein [Nonomuraea sp. G32]
MERIQGIVPGGGPGRRSLSAGVAYRELLRLELQVQRIDEEVLRRCGELAAAGPDPAAYALAHWRGPAPEPLVVSFGDVMGHVLDPPGAALQMAARAWDRAAVRAWEAHLTAGGDHLMVSSVVHRPTGEVVAATVTTSRQGMGRRRSSITPRCFLSTGDSVWPAGSMPSRPCGCTKPSPSSAPSRPPSTRRICRWWR